MDPTSKTDAQDGTPIQWQHSHLAGTQVECPGVMEIPLIPRPQDVVVQGYARNAQKMVEAQTLQESTILGPPFVITLFLPSGFSQVSAHKTRQLELSWPDPTRAHHIKITSRQGLGRISRSLTKLDQG